jgi:hypothetical protein
LYASINVPVPNVCAASMEVGCILPRRHRNRVGLIRQDCANLGCINRTRCRITSRRPYAFCDVGCILPRWQTNCVGVDSANLGCIDRTVGSRLEGHTDYVTSIALTPDGKPLVLGSIPDSSSRGSISNTVADRGISQFFCRMLMALISFAWDRDPLNQSTPLLSADG